MSGRKILQELEQSSSSGPGPIGGLPMAEVFPQNRTGLPHIPSRIAVSPTLPPLPTPPFPDPPLRSGPTSSPLPLSQSGRPLRTHRLPARYQDIYPEAPHPAALSSSSPAAAVANSSEPAVIQRVTLVVRNRFQTAPNTFGLWKEYLYRPSYDPDASISPEDLYHPHASAIVLDKEATDDVAIYTNKSTELLMNWQNSISTQKSNEETTRLVHCVLFDPQF